MGFLEPSKKPTLGKGFQGFLGQPLFLRGARSGWAIHYINPFPELKKWIKAILDRIPLENLENYLLGPTNRRE